MKGNAIVIIGGGLVKDKKGFWRTNNFDDPGDHTGTTGDRLRVEAGALLYRHAPETLVITSSYKGYLKHIPDSPVIAHVLKQELITLGVPEKKIITEDTSNTTHQNLQKLLPMFKKYHIKNITIVSNRWHLPRIKAMLVHHSELKKAYQNIVLHFAAAEDVLIKHSPEEWRPIVEKAYASKKMRERMKLERIGIEQIKNGTYQFN